MNQDGLNETVKNHSALISANALTGQIASVPEALRETVEYQFLVAAAYYSEQHKATSPDWQGAYERFRALQDYPNSTSFLAFYIPNYLLLSLRNADRSMQELESYLHQAQDAAKTLEDPIQDQLLGFLLYNWSRCLYKAECKNEAAQFWILAGQHRSVFYRHTKANDAPEDVVKAAATQVWKIYKDWPAFFPSGPVEDCGISEDLYTEVERLANTAFSAKP